MCVQALTTKATVDFDASYAHDVIEINGSPATTVEVARVLAVVSPLRTLARTKDSLRLSSVNSLTQGKGLGFSASAFASISLASSTALGLKLDLEHLSEIARLGAGSASRSVVGGFSIWYANRNGRSYAKQVASSMNLELAMGIVAIPSEVKTEMAHEESVGSPFFQARLREVKKTLRGMLRAIRNANIDDIGRLAEAESLSLHAVTMTGKNRLILMAPETIRVIQHIVTMREKNRIPVWYSLDTGPSVYVNTHPDFIDRVCREIEADLNLKVIKSGVGGPAHIVEEHLF